MSDDQWFSRIAGLANMSDDELAAGDIAAFNLTTALNLPGTERLDTDACLKKLDVWTGHVERNTRHWWHKFVESPEEYDSSPGQFRMLALVTVL